MALDFDVQGALAAGYTLPQIADYLGQRSQFDVAAARKSGYSDVDIVGSLAGSEAVEGLQGGTGAAARGWKTGMGETMPLAKAAIGLIGKTAESTFGEGGIWTGVKKWGMREYQKGMEETQPLRRDNDELTTAWEKASKDGNFGALMEWATRSAAYGAAQLAQAAVMSAVGGVAGAAMAPEAAPVAGAAGAVAGAAFKGEAMAAVKSLIEKAVVKEANRLMAESGGKLGAEAATKQATKAVASSIGKGSALLGYETGLELGSIYADAEEQARKEGRQLTGADLAKIWGTGILSGGVGMLGDKIGLDAVTGKLSSALPGGRLARTAGGAMAAGTSNAAEEGIQTMLERAGASKEVFSQEGINDIINSMGAGFMGSAPAGAVGGIISRQRQDVAVEKGKATLDQDLSVGGAQKAIDAAAAELRGATGAYLGVPPATPPVAPGMPPVAPARADGKAWSPEAAEFLANRPMPAVAPAVPMGEGGLLPAQVEAQKAMGLLPAAERRSLVPGADEMMADPLQAAPAANVPPKPSGRPWSPEAAEFMADRATGQPGGATPEQSRLSNLRTMADRDAALAQQESAAGTQFERDQAAAQRAVNLEKRAPAKVGEASNLVDLTPMTSKEAMNRLNVLRDMIANEGGNALGLAIVPHPSQKGKFAIGQRELPSLKLDPIESPVSEAEIQHRLETAALTGKERDRRAEDKQRQDMISRARASIDARGGVASPYEAQVLLEANQGQPYDRIDPSLGRPASPDQVLTARTGILVGSKAGLGYSAPESKAPRQEAKASDIKVNMRERALPSDDAAVVQARLEHAAAQGRLAAAQTNDLQQALARPAGENPVEALRNVQGNATTQADVQRLIDAANARRDAAETAEIERMLAEDAAQAKANANAVAVASQDETAQAKAREIAAVARRNLIDHLLERYAEPNNYFASAVIKAINKQLSVLQREPLTAAERARIEDLLARTRAFLQPNLPSAPERVEDRGADNSSMESQIPERGAKGPAGTPKPKVPRPSKVGGVPTAQLTDEQLSATAGNDQLPAITRRGATVELQAREEERQVSVHAAEQQIPAAKDTAPATDVYATRAEAKEAQRQQPDMRVVATEGGYTLVPKTEAQIAAYAAAARRFASDVGANGGPLNINQFIAHIGGLPASEKSELGIEKNVRLGPTKWLFGKDAMPMDRVVQALREAGYLKTDDHNEARDLIQRTLRGDPQYTPEGWDRIAEAEAQSRYEDHLEAQREEAAKATDEWTPEAIMAEDVQAVPELGRASEDLKAEVAALLDLAESHGIDRESLLERAAIATENGTENDYYEQAKALAQQAVEESDRGSSLDGTGREDEGRPRQEAQPASDADGSEGAGRPGYALEQPTSEEVVARQDQDVDTLDDLAQIRRESEAGAGLFDLKMQDGRQDTTGSLFSTQRAGDTREVKADGETHSYTVVKGLTNQPGLTKVLREIARVFGKQVVFFQSDTLKADGFVNPGNNQVVHINADSKMSPVAVLGHEMMHLFKMDNPVAYRAIATVLARQVDAGGRALFRADYGLGANMEELSADLLGNAFQDPGFLSSVFAEIGATAPEGQARSIVQRLVSALSNAIAAALKVIQGMGVQPGFKADMLVKDLEAVRSALRLAMVEYGKGQREQAQGAEQNESGEIRASRQRGQDQTETPAFKRWFKDSKVVDADGKPLVVYHASLEDFNEFKPQSWGTAGDHQYFYFAVAKQWSKRFAKEEMATDKPVLRSFYLSLQNPLDMRGLPDKTGKQWLEYFADLGITPKQNLQGKLEAAPPRMAIPEWQLLRFDTPELGGIREQLLEKGYDGIILSDVVRGKSDNTTYIAFHPEQIKSATGNNGEFDPANPDITMSRQRNQDDLFPEDFATKRTTVSRRVAVDSRGNTKTIKLKNVNSQGQQISPTVQGLDNFWDWYADGPVDEKGRPILMYHSTNGDITEFEVGRQTSNYFGLLGNVDVTRAGIFATPDNKFSQDYLKDEDGGNVMQVYMALQNPIDLRGGLTEADESALEQAGLSWDFLRVVKNDWSLFDNDEDGSNKFVEALKRAGYDGAIITEDSPTGDTDGGDTYIAFDPAQIKSATGNQGTFDPANPDITMSRQRIFGDSGRTYTPEQLRMFQNVGRSVEEPTIKERIASLRKDLGKKLVQGVFDQFDPLKALGNVPYMLARLAKGASGAMEAMLHHGKLSIRDGVYDADMSGGVLERLGVPLHGEFDDFLNWVAGHRAERLMAEGRENLFSQADIDASKTLADGTTNFDYTLQHGPNAGQVTRDRTLIYQDALKTFNEFIKNVLDIAEQSGLIDPESRKVWESEFYVPFYRVSEEGFMGDTLKNGLVRQKVIQQLKGGQEKLNDLMSNTLLNWAHLIDAAAKNRAALASLESAQQMGLAIEASEDVARQMAKAMGIKSQVVWAMDGGKRRFFVVEDKAMLQAITSLQYAGLKGPLMDAMGAFKHALTIGVTASPAFKIRNLARDSIQAIASAPLSYNLFKNLAEGYQASDPKSQTYVSALASGGLIRFGTMIEGNEAARTRRLVKMGVKDSTILNSKSKIDALWTKIEKGFMAYQELGNRGEEINRAALYKQLIDQGVPHGEAALQARDLMDFSLQGTFTTVRFLSQVVPFLNARLQGLYKLGRAGKEDPRRFAAVLGSVALASVALMMAYKDDDDWKKREDWDRNNYWWFKFGGEAFRIPKPFEIGAMATLAERGLDYFINPEMTGRRLYENVRDILMDQLSMNPIPQAVKPILDIYSNKDSFSGRPIEPMGMDRLRPDYRYTINSSMLARGISTAGQAVASQVNGQFLSPVQVDHLLHGYFSWLGTFVVGASDMALRPLTGQPERPAADFWKVATQGIVQDANSPQSRYVSQMYKQAKEVEQAYSTWNMLRKQGRLEEADQFLTDNADTIQRYKQVEKVKERETKINERIRMIERSAMSADDKKAQISELQAMRDQTARLLAQ